MDVEMHKEDIMSKSSCGGFSWAAGTWECPERAVGQGSRLRWPGGDKTKVVKGWVDQGAFLDLGGWKKGLNKGHHKNASRPLENPALLGQDPTMV